MRAIILVILVSMLAACASKPLIVQSYDRRAQHEVSAVGGVAQVTNRGNTTYYGAGGAQLDVDTLHTGRPAVPFSGYAQKVTKLRIGDTVAHEGGVAIGNGTIRAYERGGPWQRKAKFCISLVGDC